MKKAVESVLVWYSTWAAAAERLEMAMKTAMLRGRGQTRGFNLVRSM